MSITVLAFILSISLQAPFSASISSVFSSPERNDFTLSDIYAQIADGRPIRRLDDRIAIIDIGIGGRDEVADVLEILSLCEPKTVGIDVNFESAGEDDSRLIAALQSVPNLVMPLGLKAEGPRFAVEDKPFFYDTIPGITYGAINLPTATPKSSVREYAVDFPLQKGSLPSFVTALAGKYDPTAVADAVARGKRLETIAYHSREFHIYPLEEVADHAEEFTDKIVLIGSMADAGDMHPTPINSYVSGLMIHANALSTLLDREWYTSLPRYTDYVLSFIICFLIVLTTIGIRGRIRGLVVRLIQVVLAYCAVRIGYSLFVDNHVICNFSNTLLMIAFGLFSVDLWNGGASIIDHLKKKIKNLKTKEIQTNHMRKFLIILLMAIVLPAYARYSLHSVSQGVIIESAGKQTQASAGMTVKPSDHLIIPKGGKVEIYNDLDKRIYTSLAEGKISITRLMIDARSAASDNRRNVTSRLRFGKQNDSSDQRLYVTKGMVKRSLGIFDPEGEKIVADPSLIARFIASRLNCSDDNLCDSLPVPVAHSVTPEGGMTFELRNTIGFPVYFNIVKISGTDSDRTVRISEVGQPAGIYVLLPDQTLSRGHFTSVPDDEMHVLIMTHCQFDIDEMIEALEKTLKDPSSQNPADSSLPIYLMHL